MSPAGESHGGPGRPLWAGLLIGGESRRMGRPKQLLELDGATLAERALAAVAPHATGRVLLGGGAAPPALSHLPRLADAVGAEGPLAGLLAALRWRREAAWIVVACDQGRITPAAVAWLLGQRRSGVAVVLPRLSPHRVEPFLALYEPAALALLEELVARGESSLQPLATLPGVASPWPPSPLRSAWRDADTPAELARLGGRPAAR